MAPPPVDLEVGHGVRERFYIRDGDAPDGRCPSRR